MEAINNISELYKNPEKLLQTLIRFNTSNPPGNELPCIKYIEALLNSAGIRTDVYIHAPNRGSLVARIEGEGKSAPLLLYGHIDVVTEGNQEWKYPPFEGIISEDCVWGRGAIDMKGGITMMLSAILKLKAEGIKPSGDIVFAVVSDEEVDGTGAKYLIENHREIFKGIKYAIGEFGGFTMYIEGKKFYPIMVSEKQLCPVRVTFKGRGGHGSMLCRDGAMTKAAEFIRKLNNKGLPVHVTEPAKNMIAVMSSNLPFPKNIILKQLLNEKMTDRILKIMGETGEVFYPLFHNTANPTIINAGTQINVIPDEVVIQMDGRLVPGFKPQDFIAELKELSGGNGEFEIIRFDPGPSNIDMGLFKTLGDIIKESEPEGIPMPLMVSGVTDARFFSQLGIQTYGFTPMLLQKDVNFSELMHSVNERIPIAALSFGTNAIYKLLISW